MRHQWYDERMGSSQQPARSLRASDDASTVLAVSQPDPSPFLGDVGKGRFLRERHVAKLERLDGTTWVELDRYGTPQDAGVALDAAVASGTAAGTLRVTQVSVKTSMRVLTIVGAVLAVAFVAFFLYVFLAG